MNNGNTAKPMAKVPRNIKMKKTLLIVVALLISFCLGFFFKAIVTQPPKPDMSIKKALPKMNMKKVTGIGGVFFKSKDPERIKGWYKAHLGFETDQYGARFEWQEASNPPRRSSIQWSPFSETTNYFEPSTKDFMVNYRVENLDSLVYQLKNENVELLDSVATYAYGKFVHLMDPDGNKIELYEPNFDYKPNEKLNN